MNRRANGRIKLSKQRVSPKWFILAWQKANTADDIARATGLSFGAIRFRGFYYRRKGVPLKPLLARNWNLDVLNWAKLRDFAIRANKTPNSWL